MACQPFVSRPPDAIHYGMKAEMIKNPRMMGRKIYEILNAQFSIADISSRHSLHVFAAKILF